MNFDEENEPTALELEMRQIACRLAEAYGLDSVVILGCKQETTDGTYSTMASHANAGNLYAGKHLARRYANS